MESQIATEKHLSGSIVTASSASECLQLSVQLQSISKVIFIDAGNVFNPYYLHRTFRGEMEIREALSNINISRPFTIYQLRQVILDLLPESGHSGSGNEGASTISLPHGSKVLIIPCIDDMFYEDGLDREEAKQVFMQTISILRETVAKSSCYCFISFIGKYYRRMFESGDLITLQ
ncbi:MAG: hypothetical protein V1835_04375 [Candidatus Micrarchaeota archaeon]